MATSGIAAGGPGASGPGASGTAGRVDIDQLAGLEEERDGLLAALDDLDREYAEGGLLPDEYTALRDDYTARTAEVLRAIDEGREALPNRRPVRWPVVAAVVGVVALVAALAGVLIARESGSRLDGALTGDVDRSRRELVLEAQTRLANGDAAGALEITDELLAGDPDDVDALVVAAEAQLADDQTLAGIETLDRVLAADPDHPRATFLKGLVLVSLPEPDLQAEGIGLLDRAVELAPQNGEAWAVRGAAYELVRGDQAEADRSYARARALGVEVGAG
jgi:tetratricopeptide (TPR) repeat protein